MSVVYEVRDLGPQGVEVFQVSTIVPGALLFCGSWPSVAAVPDRYRDRMRKGPLCAVGEEQDR